LGRLGLSCAQHRVRRAAQEFDLSGTRGEIDRCFQRTFGTGLYADEFFRYLGAKEIISADRSNYEGATLLHDLNRPFPGSLRSSFDLVMDGGTLEHIFDFPSALRHCLELVSVGGHFITITPANQWMGHGFYQFSPELYFRVFNADNGFVLRKIVLFECMKIDATFYEVKDPAIIGRRVQLNSPKLVMLAVLARKTAEVPIFARPPQQSDYAAVWNEHQEKEKITPGIETGRPSFFRRLRAAVNPYWPFWLRYLKSRLIVWRTEGRPSLSNTRQFRRLSRVEIARERSDRATS
jgi:SAM-dependent methyltransferase